MDTANATTFQPTESPSPSHLRVDWRAEALVLALVIAEAAVLWLIVDLVLGATEGEGVRVPALAVGVLVVLGSGLPRWLDALDVWDRVYATGILVGVFSSTLVAIKLASFPEIAWSNPDWLRETAHALVLRPNPERVAVWGVIAVSAIAWWRGKTRAVPGSDAALTTLRFGTLAALVAATGQISVRTEGAAGSTSAAVIVFFGASLAAVALARLRPDGTVNASGLGTRWLAAMLAPVLVVMVGAVIVAGLLSRDLLDTILWFLSPVIWTLALLVRVIILVMALIAFIVLSPILWFLSRHPINFAGVHIQPAEAPPEDQLQRTVERSSQVPDAIRYLIAAAILMMLFAGVTKLVLRRRGRQTTFSDEERSSVLDTTDLFGLLKTWLASRFGRQGLLPDPLADLRGDPRWAQTVAIRETYGQFLTWSRDQDRPRRIGTTPSEHERTLRDRASRAEITLLTNVYNITRYSDVPATSAQADVVKNAWERMRGEQAT